jgi:hypothetical protein
MVGEVEGLNVSTTKKQRDKGGKKIVKRVQLRRSFSTRLISFSHKKKHEKEKRQERESEIHREEFRDKGKLFQISLRCNKVVKNLCSD